MFLLGPQRDADVVAAFKQYENYLEANRHRFPPSAFSLATSDWYHGFSSHQAPHDAWLESAELRETSSGTRQEIRIPSLTIRLLGAFHDGHIELHYPQVFGYRLAAHSLGQGHGDWRYDEFRLDEQGRLVHEIEWAAFGAENSWIIVASDVHHKWLPLVPDQSRGQ